MRHARPDWNGRIVDLDGRIPADEPVLLVRGKDIAAAPTARAWAEYAALRGADHGITSRVRAWADLIDAWQREHPDVVKVPDLPPDVDSLAPSSGPVEWLSSEDGDQWCAVGVHHRSVENVLDFIDFVRTEDLADEPEEIIRKGRWVIGVGTNDIPPGYSEEWSMMWNVDGRFLTPDGDDYTPEHTFPVTLVLA